MTRKYKKGERVRVVDCPALREWCDWRECVNKTCVIDRDSDDIFYYLDDNKYGINFTDEMLRPTKVTNWKRRLAT